MDNKAYVEIFLQEANENLQELNNNLLYLENDPKSLETLSNIFRIAHTFKGMSATMGYIDMANLTHKMEDVLSLFKEGEINVTPKVISVLFKCLDILERMVNNVDEDNGVVENTDDIINELSKFKEKNNNEMVMENDVSTDSNNKKETLDDHEEYIVKEAEKIGKSVYDIKVNLAKDTLMKSVRAFIIMTTLENVGEVIKTIPCVEDIEEERFESELGFMLITDLSEKEIVDTLLNLSEVVDVYVKNIRRIDAHLNGKNIKAIDVNSNATNSDDDKDINKAKGEIKRSSQWVKIDLQRVDELMSMVSEIVIQRTALEDYSINLSLDNNNISSKSNIKDIIESLKKTTTELQELVMKIRMLPLDTVFSRFPRLIRDLSLELDKNVEFIVEGSSIELDRTIINEISEPLVHLLRNSMDHGIEGAEERKKLSKPEKATLKLSANEEGNNVVIKVSDDGKGLSYEKIKKKAEGLGIDTKDMSQKEVLSLIFNQGLTTNENVTSISGRGVGMDAVRTKIEAFGGSVDFVTEEEVGTTFIIKLPLTLQVFQGLLVDVNGYTFTIQESFVDSIAFYEKKKESVIDGESFYDLNGKVIPLIHLDKKLNLEKHREDNKEEEYVIIIKSAETLFAVSVHGIVAQREIVVKPIPNTLKGINMFSGTTVLGNGTPILILDITKFI